MENRFAPKPTFFIENRTCDNIFYAIFKAFFKKNVTIDFLYNVTCFYKNKITLI